MIHKILSERVIKKNDAVMFDIDDTLIRSSDGKIIKVIFHLLEYCKWLGYKIIIVTARLGINSVINYTVDQLAYHSIYYDELIFTPAEKKGKFKSNSKYNFILSVGDQDTDLTYSKYKIKVKENHVIVTV